MPPTIHSLPLRMSNAYLVENDQGVYLVDAGAPGDAPKIMEAIQRLGKPLRLVFITHAHFDHYGSATAIRAQTGAPIAIHAADAHAMAQGQTPIQLAHGRGRLTMPFLPFMKFWERRIKTPPDILLGDGDRLNTYGLAAMLLHTPGHTAGSSCLLVEDKENGSVSAFAGDLVTAGQQPRLQRLYANDWSQLGQSLVRLQAQHPALVYAGHGAKPIEQDAFQKITV